MKPKYVILIISFAISSTLFLILSYMSFNSHQLSMSRVFNVEKSMAVEFYPYKISQALIDGKSLNDIKKIIGANYWVFNTVITDCKTQEDVCSNQKIILSQQLIDDPSILNNETWVPLRDPAPFYSEKIVSPYKEDGKVYAKSHNNTGEIIGRIYFLESEYFISRTLTKSLEYWISNAPAKLVDGRKNNDNYSFTKNLVVSLALFITMFALGVLVNWIQTRRLKERLGYDRATKNLKREYDMQKLEKDKLVLDLESLDADKSKILSEQALMQEASLKLERQQRQLIENNAELEKKYNFILNYAMANKFQLESEFTAPLRNQIQRLDLIIEGLSQRNHYDTKDSLHDLRKAKLLLLTDDQLNNQPSIAHLHEQLVQSRETIKWTAENTERLADLSMQDCDVYDTIKKFLNNRPPSAILKYVEVNFESQSINPLIIKANPYHIQAIVKNALYNALSELEDICLIDYFDNPEDFNGKVDIVCGAHETNSNYVFIKVADNAGGMPDKFINEIYESHKKINPDAVSLEGNGSLIVNSYLSMYGAKVIKRNINDGFEVTFLFKRQIRSHING